MFTYIIFIFFLNETSKCITRILNRPRNFILEPTQNGIRNEIDNYANIFHNRIWREKKKKKFCITVGWLSSLLAITS